MTTANSNAVPGLLVVEGHNDQHLVLHLCKLAQPQLEAKFTYHDAKGLPCLLRSVRGRVNEQNHAAVGFLMDSDDDSLARWREVTSRITEANSEIPIPAAPDPKGTIITENPDIGSPRIGIWLMPDNSSAGELENFVARMIPQKDPVWPLSQGYIDGIPAPDRRFGDKKITKSQVHAWLAARKYPGLMGLAIREGDLAIDGELTRTFLTWLTRLFD